MGLHSSIVHRISYFTWSPFRRPYACVVKHTPHCFFWQVQGAGSHIEVCDPFRGELCSMRYRARVSFFHMLTLPALCIENVVSTPLLTVSLLVKLGFMSFIFGSTVLFHWSISLLRAPTTPSLPLCSITWNKVWWYLLKYSVSSGWLWLPRVLWVSIENWRIFFLWMDENFKVNVQRWKTVLDVGL